MGRPTPGHYDDVFVSKFKKVIFSSLGKSQSCGYAVPEGASPEPVDPAFDFENFVHDFDAKDPFVTALFDVLVLYPANTFKELDKRRLSGPDMMDAIGRRRARMRDLNPEIFHDTALALRRLLRNSKIIYGAQASSSNTQSPFSIPYPSETPYVGVGSDSEDHPNPSFPSRIFGDPLDATDHQYSPFLGIPRALPSNEDDLDVHNPLYEVFDAAPPYGTSWTSRFGMSPPPSFQRPIPFSSFDPPSREVEIRSPDRPSPAYGSSAQPRGSARRRLPILPSVYGTPPPRSDNQPLPSDGLEGRSQEFAAYSALRRATRRGTDQRQLSDLDNHGTPFNAQESADPRPNRLRLPGQDLIRDRRPSWDRAEGGATSASAGPGEAHLEDDEERAEIEFDIRSPFAPSDSLIPPPEQIRVTQTRQTLSTSQPHYSNSTIPEQAQNTSTSADPAALATLSHPHPSPLSTRPWRTSISHAPPLQALRQRLDQGSSHLGTSGIPLRPRPDHSRSGSVRTSMSMRPPHSALHLASSSRMFRSPAPVAMNSDRSVATPNIVRRRSRSSSPPISISRRRNLIHLPEIMEPLSASRPLSPGSISTMSPPLLNGSSNILPPSEGRWLDRSPSPIPPMPSVSAGSADAETEVSGHENVSPPTVVDLLIPSPSSPSESA